VGQAYYQECTELIHRATDLVDHMREMKGAPTGILRIHALPGFMLGYIALPLRRFQETYPEIILDLVVYDLVIDPVKEGFDCTLQIFPPASELLVERRMFPVRRVFCSSPGYLEQHGEPKAPGELLQHRLGRIRAIRRVIIGYSIAVSSARRWSSNLP
jgi:DNA-binding transcriptional LysR family regulator